MAGLHLSPIEALILEMLISNGEMYGLEMVKFRPDQVKRGTVYVTLNRMVKKGFLESRKVDNPRDPGLPRRLYRPTGFGERVYSLGTIAGSLALAGAT